MPRADVVIQTRDGACPASVFTPARSPGPWPAVIFFMDGLGVRPALWAMAERLAEGGYLVLLPDLYYRLGGSPPANTAQTQADGRLRDEVKRRLATLDHAHKLSDTAACIEFLSAHPDVEGHRFGAIGYFTGGAIALIAAGAFPDRFAAVASFHGADLATERADSPHLFASRMMARVYVAAADHDTHFPDEQRRRLQTALADAGVDHLMETYDGARHGFATADLPAFDPVAAERHWTALFKLFDTTLGRANDRPGGSRSH
jgi:carboxymethylenebutenolidase